MKRNLIDVCKCINSNTQVVKDCTFDQLYLVGKRYPLGKHTISFVADKKYIEDFLKYNISGAICTPEVADALKGIYSGGIVITDDPKTVFWKIHNYYASTIQDVTPNVISKSATIHDTVIIDEDNVIIGDNTIICANVIIKSGTKIGSNCVIREGCVIGSPAFYYFGNGSEKTLVTSTGTVEIGNNVELHTNVTVEKGVLGGATIIGSNTKIDNVSLIGHDSIIGENVTMAAGATLAGGVELGDNSFLGVGVTIAPYVKCGAYVKLSAGAVATKDIPNGVHESGNFAIPHGKYLKHIKNISK